ncbi:MAG: acetylxylan esterase, partial [Chitinophagaceae bacterium]|nr:acetylxylan esterase [Chitinophagaceae bacterium]
MKYVSGKENPAAWQSGLRDSLINVLKLGDLLRNRDKIEFKPVVLRTENKGAYILKQIEFNSTPGRRVKVIVTIPAKKSGKFPAVVSIHGHGGLERTVYDTSNEYKGFARHLAERNYVTIAPFVSQHEVYEKDQLLMGERLFDCIRAVDFLQTLPQVDTSRIGAAGLSLGGEMVMWLAGMDTRIKAAVSAGFLTTMDNLEEGHCLCWKFPGLRDLADFT